MIGSSGRTPSRVGRRGAWLLTWLTLALLTALFVNVPLGVCVEMPLDAGFNVSIYVPIRSVYLPLVQRP